MLNSLQAISGRNISTNYCKKLFRIPCALLLILHLLLLLPMIPIHAEAVDYSSFMFTISGPLTVNGTSMGEIEIGIDESQNFYIPFETLQSLIPELMKEEAAAQFLAAFSSVDADQWIPVDALESEYISHEFSMADLSLSLTIKPSVRLPRSISVTTPSSPPAGTRIERLPYSFFMNSSASSYFEIDRSDQFSPYSLPMELRFSPYLNIGRSTLNTNLRFKEQNLLNGIGLDDEEFRQAVVNAVQSIKDSAQYVYDFPEGPVLFQFGNITYDRHTFQTADTRIGGVLKKDLSYQTDSGNRETLSKSPELDLLLEENAVAVIKVNDNEVRREYLTAGNYLLRNFSLREGINKIEISTITDKDDSEPDSRVYYRGFSHSVLPPGNSSFVLGLGAPAWQSFDTPILFMNHDIGINRISSAGYFIELSAAEQLFGFSGILASRFGTFSADTAFSNAEDTPFGGALSLEYMLFPLAAAARSSTVLSGTFKSEHFAQFNSAPDDSIFSFSLSHNRRIFGKTGLSIQGTADIPRSLSWKDTESLLRVGLSSTLFKQISLSGSLQSSWEDFNDADPDITGSIYVSYRPYNSDVSISANQTGPSNAAVVSWTPENDKGYTSTYQAQATNITWDDPKPDRIVLSDRIQHQFFNTRFQQQFIKDPQGKYDIRTEAEIETALVHAAGTTAFSSPIHRGFVLIRPEGGFRDYPIIADRSRAGVEISTEKTGTAVVSNISPFYSNRIRIRAVELEAGYNLTEDDFLFNPSYSGAGLISVGDEAPPVSVSGRFLTPDWQPLTFVSGTVHTFNGERLEQPKLMFTDDTGYFEIHNLQPGTFLLTLNHDQRRTFRIIIPEGFEGRHELGTLLYGGSPLVQPFPPLGSQIQLKILQRRLMEADMNNDPRYDIPRLIKRVTHETILVHAADPEAGVQRGEVQNTDSEHPESRTAENIFPSAAGSTSITGRFTDQMGQPAEYIRGALTSFNGRSLLHPVQFRTNGTGEFTLWGVSSGSYEIILYSSDDEPKKWFSLHVPEGLHGYFDVGTIQFSGETAADIRPEAPGRTETTETADQADQRDILIDLSGKLVDEHDESVPFTAGSIRRYNGILLSEDIRFRTDADGVFSLAGLVPGSYTMIIHDIQQRYFSMEIPEDISSGKKYIGTVQYGSGNAAADELSGNTETRPTDKEMEK